MSRPYHYVIHCRWCDDAVDDNGPDFKQDDDGYLYHTDCWADMKYEEKSEQFMKHAPDNMG